MFVVISWILIIIAIIIILSIVVKKFPALAILNVTSMSGEKEAKFKERIIQNRVERDLAVVSGFLGRIWLSIVRSFSAFLKERQTQLKKIRSNYTASLKIPWLEKQKKIRELSVSAEDALKMEDEKEAEEKLVEIISLDPKNLDAFFRLGNLYASEKKWPETRETYAYALKLSRQSGEGDEALGETTPQEIYFSISEMEKEAGDIDAALENIREALELEPNSPRYLDLILDLSIMRKDKELAESSLAKLAAVNPENQKLGEWAEKIENL